MNNLTEIQVRLFASAQSWIEGEAVRQLYATAKLDGVCHAVGFPDLHHELPPSQSGVQKLITP